MMEKPKSNVKKADIIKVVVLALVLIWIICFFIDYFRARDAKDPFFCISKQTKTYDDGTVFSCTGLGYKMYRYNRASVSTQLEFGPFFMKERTK